MALTIRQVARSVISSLVAGFLGPKLSACRRCIRDFGYPLPCPITDAACGIVACIKSLMSRNWGFRTYLFLFVQSGCLLFRSLVNPLPARILISCDEPRLVCVAFEAVPGAMPRNSGNLRNGKALVY